MWRLTLTVSAPAVIRRIREAIHLCSRIT